MKTDAGILIVGQSGFFEQSLKRFFTDQGYRCVWISEELGLDATIQPSVYNFFQKEKPQYVILGSVLSGGILANKKAPADFIYKNSESQNNILYASWKFGVEKLIYVGSSCMYPENAEQPMIEASLLTGPLECNSEPYAVAKIAGVKLCQAFSNQYGLHTAIVVPATLYGPQQNIDVEESHVLSALLSKFIDADRQESDVVSVWGSGNPRREFIYIDDFSAALLLILKKSGGNGELLNVGTDEDISIKDLAQLIAKEAGYHGRIEFDTTKPDGAMQKLLDSSKMKKYSWKPSIGLEEGIQRCVKAIKQMEKV